MWCHAFTEGRSRLQQQRAQPAATVVGGARRLDRRAACIHPRNIKESLRALRDRPTLAERLVRAASPLALAALALHVRALELDTVPAIRT